MPLTGNLRIFAAVWDVQMTCNSNAYIQKRLGKLRVDVLGFAKYKKLITEYKEKLEGNRLKNINFLHFNKWLGVAIWLFTNI